MSIARLFRYCNKRILSDIFSNFGKRDFNVGCQISPTLRPMLMPTYGEIRGAVVALGEQWWLLGSSGAH
jgi:hypothetical protein